MTQVSLIALGKFSQYRSWSMDCAFNFDRGFSQNPISLAWRSIKGLSLDTVSTSSLDLKAMHANLARLVFSSSYLEECPSQLSNTTNDMFHGHLKIGNSISSLPLYPLSSRLSGLSFILSLCFLFPRPPRRPFATKPSVIAAASTRF